MNQPRVFRRSFQVWAYTVGHGQLLLRSTKSSSETSRIDILFKDIGAMRLAGSFDELTVSLGVAQNVGLDPLAPECKHRSVYLLDGSNFQGFVVARAMFVFEDDKDYDEPSELYDW